MFRTALNYISFVVAGALLLIAFAVMQFWPASWWLDVQSVRVFDAKQGTPVVMAVVRTVKRDFRGEWVASIRRLENGRWINFCTATGKTNYGKEMVFPDPLTLQWWTHPSCHPLPAGKYVMRTSWVILNVSFFPDKEVQADSNIFEVAP